jgi:hypothetical protein
MVAWQIPLGNTVRRAMDNTWDHYQDNRVQWLLGPDYAGADGTTCACDGADDGVTNQPPIDGKTHESVSADDDGGYFKQQSAAYYRAGAVALP